jgi:hypothetical protein
VSPQRQASVGHTLMIREPDAMSLCSIAVRRWPKSSFYSAVSSMHGIAFALADLCLAGRQGPRLCRARHNPRKHLAANTQRPMDWVGEEVGEDWGSTTPVGCAIGNSI